MTSSDRRSAPTYKELARSGAALDRTLMPAQCRRLQEACGELGEVAIHAEFGFDDDNRIAANLHVTVQVELDCHMCLEPRPWQLDEVFELRLAHDEHEARRWGASDEADRTEDGGTEIVVVKSERLDMVELVEDGVLLRLPSVVCNDETCERRPELSYDDGEDAAVETAPSPFAGLQTLGEELAGKKKPAEKANREQDGNRNNTDAQKTE